MSAIHTLSRAGPAQVHIAKGVVTAEEMREMIEELENYGSRGLGSRMVLPCCPAAWLSVLSLVLVHGCSSWAVSALLAAPLLLDVSALLSCTQCDCCFCMHRATSATVCAACCCL